MQVHIARGCETHGITVRLIVDENTTKDPDQARLCLVLKPFVQTTLRPLAMMITVEETLESFHPWVSEDQVPLVRAPWPHHQRATGLAYRCHHSA